MQLKRPLSLTILIMAVLTGCLQAEKVSLDSSGAQGFLLQGLTFELGLLSGGSANNGPTLIISGLTWQRCAYGQTWDGSTCTGSATGVVICATTPCNTSGNPISSGAAFDACDTSTVGGYTDWRLPTASELLSIVYCSNGRTSSTVGSSCDPGYSSPTVDSSLFPGIDTTYLYVPSDVYGGTSNPYSINFTSGYYYYSTFNSTAAVRCVR